MQRGLKPLRTEDRRCPEVVGTRDWLWLLGIGTNKVFSAAISDSIILVLLFHRFEVSCRGKTDVFPSFKERQWQFEGESLCERCGERANVRMWQNAPN